MNQKQRDTFVRLLGDGDLAHTDIILAVDVLRARVAEIEPEWLSRGLKIVERDHTTQVLNDRVAELEAKLSEQRISDIVYIDWHNSLTPSARKGLSLHVMCRLVSMLLDGGAKEGE